METVEPSGPGRLDGVAFGLDPDVEDGVACRDRVADLLLHLVDHSDRGGPNGCGRVCVHRRLERHIVRDRAELNDGVRFRQLPGRHGRIGHALAVGKERQLAERHSDSHDHHQSDDRKDPLANNTHVGTFVSAHRRGQRTESSAVHPPRTPLSLESGRRRRIIRWANPARTRDGADGGPAPRMRDGADGGPASGAGTVKWGDITKGTPDSVPPTVPGGPHHDRDRT